MEKQNCWEVKKCGRQPNGDKVRELGICKAAIDSTVDGCNFGKNGGRICWAIAGTLCGGKVQGTFAEKYSSCFECPFLKTVRNEEGINFKLKP